jgi:hypothetical protein
MRLQTSKVLINEDIKKKKNKERSVQKRKDYLLT